MKDEEMVGKYFIIVLPFFPAKGTARASFLDALSAGKPYVLRERICSVFQHKNTRVAVTEAGTLVDVSRLRKTECSNWTASLEPAPVVQESVPSVEHQIFRSVEDKRPPSKVFVAIRTKNMGDDEHWYAYYENKCWWETTIIGGMCCKKEIADVLLWRLVTQAEQEWMGASCSSALHPKVGTGLT